jgi:hypothetical protein
MGLNKNTFQYWKRKFAQVPTQSLLFPVKLKPDVKIESPPASSGISLELGGYLLKLDKDFDERTLLSLIEILKKS